MSQICMDCGMPDCICRNREVNYFAPNDDNIRKSKKRWRENKNMMSQNEKLDFIIGYLSAMNETLARILEKL